ncbi:M15 family metallopeptidase [Bacillus sp. ISL-18]|uniref:M15 family metallopeptidase n=1 Tax=Bacillus sp. ISL-18 TaxID=2819118 RepID=UPI001BEAAC43|nr:M15 family metallopeptidase [Bacillus sp. ISL-18]
MLTYQTRNLENINKLGDHTKVAALKWHDYLVANHINVLIYETIRTIETQRANVKKGASQTMKSYHIVGQALDFVPVDEKGKGLWNGYSRSDIKQAIAEAKRLGFEWGGDWKGFVDKPHLQFNYKGYGTDTFGQNKPVEETKKETPKPVVKTVSQTKTKKLTYKRLLKLGSKGADVGELQGALNRLNFKCGKIDNDYGKVTKDAVTRFQKVHLPYEIDGIAGKHTIEMINSLL